MEQLMKMMENYHFQLLLFQYIKEVKPDAGNQEYYLTDIISVFLAKGLTVETLKIDSYKELVGLNTPEDIQWAEGAVLSN